jgi:hypothetical protein
MERGKQYRVQEKHTNRTEVVVVEHISKKGVVTVLFGGFLGLGGRLDITPEEVARLDWFPMD